MDRPLSVHFRLAQATSAHTRVWIGNVVPTHSQSFYESPDDMVCLDVRDLFRHSFRHLRIEPTPAPLIDREIPRRERMCPHELQNLTIH